MSWRFRRDPLRARIETYGRLTMRLYKQLDRDIRFPFDPPGWWSYVGMRAAATGAAIALGEYRRRLADDAAEPERKGDPIAAFAAVANDAHAMRPAYRVLAWGAMAEITAELWSPRYDDEMTDAAHMLIVESPYEAKIRAAGAALVGDGERERRRDAFESEVFAAMVSAATGADTLADHPALADGRARWLECFHRGRAAAESRLQQLAFTDVPVTLDG